MSPLFLKIGTSVLLLQSIGIRFDFKILLKSFVNQVNPFLLSISKPLWVFHLGPHAFLFSFFSMPL
ncbi:hypothetical protein Syun_017214 [Stephania yunnanensis]|uniref:Uncharacterized protein n=1 Tax=Stephania yunnanensis TaxID=152371 RepID=A0AAP0J8V0_9MAGN